MVVFRIWSVFDPLKLNCEPSNAYRVLITKISFPFLSIWTCQSLTVLRSKLNGTWFRDTNDLKLDKQQGNVILTSTQTNPIPKLA